MDGDLEIMAYPDIFAGNGEMAALCRQFDWSTTPLGDVAGWSHSLRSTVRLVLASRHPMFMWWGGDLIQVYNDAYRPSLADGGRHPAALGMSGPLFWTDIWPIIGPQIEGVMTRGEATWHEDHLVPIIRNGRLEEVYWTYGYSPIHDDDGSIGGTLVVCTETTQRVQATAERARLIEAERAARAEAETAKAQLTRVLEQAPVAIAVLEGRDLRFTMANPQYTRMIGGREAVGHTLIEVLPDLAGSEIERVLQRVHDTGEPFIANDFLVRFDSQGAGEIDNYYDFVYHPLKEGGSVTGVVAVAVDMTQRHDAASERESLLEEARAARSEAEQANRAKSEFLTVMSHELRTPLNAISGYADIIGLGLHGPVTDEQRDDLDRIRASQRHLLGLINGVLNYARIEAGVVTFDPDDVALADCLETCRSLTAPQARSAGLRLVSNPVDAELMVRADPEKLQQIVLNLLTNAIKFTDAGGSIEMRVAADDDVVAITVADTGRGIPADELAHIFEAFVQLGSRLTRTTEGVGLGLPISRDLARGMGGDLTVESEPGAGSRFTVTLPRSRQGSADGTEASAAEGTAGSTGDGTEPGTLGW